MGIALLSIGRPKIDYLDPDTIQKCLTDFSYDIVINAAAFTNVEEAETNSSTAMAINGIGPGSLAKQLAAKNIPLVHFSTDYIFDGSNEQPYSELATVNPLSVYGRTKLEGERRIRTELSRSLIFRTSWVYSSVGSNFVKTMLRLAKNNKEVRVVDDQFGSPTFATDLARAVLRITKFTRINDYDLDNSWGTYHLSGRGITSWADFAKKVYEISSMMGGPSAEVLTIPSAEYPTISARPANSSLNCEKARATFGTKLPHWHLSLERCIAEILNGGFET